VVVDTANATNMFAPLASLKITEIDANNPDSFRYGS